MYNMNWVEDMINDYYKWLRQRTTTRLDETTGWSAISTPYILRSTLSVPWACGDNETINFAISWKDIFLLS